MLDAGVDVFLVPRADAHQGEYVVEADERLAWLTGFTGSAGFAAILADEAGMFVDGRYTLQVRAQVADVFTPVAWPETKLGPWLIERLESGASVGFDPWLHTVEEVRGLRKLFDSKGISMKPLDNLVDAIRDDRPARPKKPLRIHDIAVAGESHDDKRARLAKGLRTDGISAAIITLPDSLCWLLNVRGSDIARNPLVQGFGILRDDATVTFFTNATTDDAVTAHLGADVTLAPYKGLPDALPRLSGKVLIDAGTAPDALCAILSAEIVEGRDPCVLPKARKTNAEITATRAAHIRDGAAMIEFLAWFDREAPGGSLTEIDAAKALEGFRRATNALQDISFDTISGAGPNGAIVHYRVTEDTNRAINEGELYLVDSGGQYLDGTTDITRTVVVGEATTQQKADFTRVLQGMIAISRVRFPKGLAGRDLDALARAPLWMAGQDYMHGTGHGVGVFLCVHEGPQRLSRVSEVPLEPGMILSNEPGYYREGEYGIRIENLIVVREAEPMGDNRAHYDFETLTWVPIDLRLVDTNLLAPCERDWLNAYHAQIRTLMDGRLSDEAATWLEQATRVI